MVRKITLRQVGGSIGATLPKDMADRLHVKPGDEIFAVETDAGILEVVNIMLGMADGSLTREEFAAWIGSRMVPFSE